MFVYGNRTGVERVDEGVERQVLGFDDHLMLVRVTFAKGAVGYLHQHPHRQVTYVERGTFETTIDGRTAVLGAGDCYFVPPNHEHGVVALEDGALIDVFAPAREDFVR
jgi:quercetin dioxygenase-like cupin family protein